LFEAAVAILLWLPQKLEEHCMTFPYPYLRCPHCTEQIRFPYPTLQEPTSNQPRVPTDTWHIELLCYSCEKWFGARARDVQMVPPHTGAHSRWLRNPVFFRIECECGQPNCQPPEKMFVSTTKFCTPSEIQKFFADLKQKPTCEKCHPLRFCSAIEVFSLF